MGICWQLVNNTKKESIDFGHLPFNTKNEILYSPVACRIVTWYLIENAGNEIQFVSHTYDDWPFREGNKSELGQLKYVTDEIISQFILEGMLKDHGKLWVDEEAESVLIRDIRIAEDAIRCY